MKFEKLVTQTPLEKPKIRESLLPFLTVKEALLAETTKPLWKHGTALRTRYQSFEVDENLVEKHLPTIVEQDIRIGALLQHSSNCDWQTLFTHPKLMSGYYWKDYRLHNNKQEKIDEIKWALKLKQTMSRKYTFQT